MGRLAELDGLNGGEHGAGRARVVTTMRRSIAIALGLVACQTRAIDPDKIGSATQDDGDDGDEHDGSGDDDSSEASGDDEGTQSSDPTISTATITTITTDPTDTSTDTDEPQCMLNPEEWTQIMVCMPPKGGSCVRCDDDPECRALAESMSEGCDPQFQNTLCGPELQGDACCSVVFVDDWGCAGRPFLVDGTARTADAVRRDDWHAGPRPRLDGIDAAQCAAIAAHWEQTALAEHASVASFARFVLDLLAEGAPPELVLAAQRALGDEVVHARLAFGLASAYAGAPIGPGRLAVDGALDRDRTLAEIVRSVVIEGCVGETVSSAQAELALLECSDAAVRKVLTTIARDERRHAQLAWQFVGWALARDPSLRELVADTFTMALVGIELSPTLMLDSGDPVLRAHGVLARDELVATTRAIASDVIAPCYAAMLQSAPLAA